MLAPWLSGASTSEDPSLSLNGREQNTSFVSSPSGGLPCGQSGACSQLQSVQSQTPSSSPALHSEEPNFQITLIRPQPVPNRLHHINLDPPPILLLFKLQAPILTVRPNRILPSRVPTLTDFFISCAKRLCVFASFSFLAFCLVLSGCRIRCNALIHCTSCLRSWSIASATSNSHESATPGNISPAAAAIGLVPWVVVTVYTDILFRRSCVLILRNSVGSFPVAFFKRIAESDNGWPYGEFGCTFLYDFLFSAS